MSLWAITCFFNPAGRASRLRNYRIFRRQLEVPLLTVELALNGEPELTPSDADHLHQIRGGPEHILWQKERLLNLALEHLPAECTAVAWLDCDIVFANPEWPTQAKDLLAKHQLIQLFDRVVYLPQEMSSMDLMKQALVDSASYYWQPGAVSNARKPHPLSYPKISQRGTSTTGNPGMAWAAQRPLLDRHGLYDRAIVGSGDLFLHAALFARDKQLDRRLPRGTPARQDFDRWASGLLEDLNTPVSHCSGTIFHCWHGELVNRGYNERHRAISQFDFDPATDIRLDNNGCWRWNSGKEELQLYLRQYFESRREDEPGADDKSKE